jgi:transposase-like protein
VAAATGKDALVPAPHPQEFRQRAVELARQKTKPVADLAKELRISESCLRNWMAQADVDDNGSATQLTSTEKKELAVLRRDKRRLEMEVEIRSGYYAWLTRLDSPRRQEDELLLKHIIDIHAESRGTYGSPRMHAELTVGLGLPVNLKRVARLMRHAGIQGPYRRRRHGCTVRDPDAQPSADLVNRQFTVDALNRLWITDMTGHPTAEGRAHAHRVGHRCARYGDHSPAARETHHRRTHYSTLRLCRALC